MGVLYSTPAAQKKTRSHSFNALAPCLICAADQTARKMRTGLQRLSGRASKFKRLSVQYSPKPSAHILFTRHGPFSITSASGYIYVSRCDIRIVTRREFSGVQSAENRRVKTRFHEGRAAAAIRRLLPKYDKASLAVLSVSPPE